MTQEAKKSANPYFYAVGKRKTSIAKVYITPNVKGGAFEVNGKDIAEYFSGTFIANAKSPLALTQKEKSFDVKVVVCGGGFSSQSDAVRHGISRALELYDPTLRLVMKAEGFLTRDPRSKERRKYGHRKARKSPQWSKR